MSSLKLFTKMLDNAGIPFSENSKGTNTDVLIDSPLQDGSVLITFSNKGEHFYNALFTFYDEAFEVSGKPLTNNDGGDYDHILNMISKAPVKMGSYLEAASPDGQYIGILYFPKGEETGVAWVCDA